MNTWIHHKHVNTSIKSSDGISTLLPVPMVIINEFTVYLPDVIFSNGVTQCRKYTEPKLSVSNHEILDVPSYAACYHFFSRRLISTIVVHMIMNRAYLAIRHFRDGVINVWRSKYESVQCMSSKICILPALSQATKICALNGSLRYNLENGAELREWSLVIFDHSRKRCS